jgi:hypothetical protein
MTVMTRSGARFWWGEELPKHVLHLYKDTYDPSEKWKEYTVAERNAKRKERQDANIERKRKCLRRVPCYIHVFRNDTDWFLGGWYIVIWSIYGPGPHGMWYLNWKEDSRHKEFLPRIRQHFPLGLLPIVDDITWFKAFCKAYPMKPRGIQRPRGKYLIHCIIDSDNRLIDMDLGGEG